MKGADFELESEAMRAKGSGTPPPPLPGPFTLWPCCLVVIVLVALPVSCRHAGEQKVFHVRPLIVHCPHFPAVSNRLLER